MIATRSKAKSLAKDVFFIAKISFFIIIAIIVYHPYIFLSMLSQKIYYLLQQPFFNKRALLPKYGAEPF
jgi:hypothetical protein